MTKAGGWTAIEVDDATTKQLAEVHVMPVAVLPPLNTFKEAVAFTAMLEKAGEPCVMCPRDDGGGPELRTYFGHTLSGMCDCKPTTEPNAVPMYIHHQRRTLALVTA